MEGAKRCRETEPQDFEARKKGKSMQPEEQLAEIWEHFKTIKRQRVSADVLEVHRLMSTREATKEHDRRMEKERAEQSEKLETLRIRLEFLRREVNVLICTWSGLTDILNMLFMSMDWEIQAAATEALGRGEMKSEDLEGQGDLLRFVEFTRIAAEAEEAQRRRMELVLDKAERNVASSTGVRNVRANLDFFVDQVIQRSFVLGDLDMNLYVYIMETEPAEGSPLQLQLAYREAFPGDEVRRAAMVEHLQCFLKTGTPDTELEKIALERKEFVFEVLEWYTRCLAEQKYRP